MDHGTRALPQQASVFGEDGYVLVLVVGAEAMDSSRSRRVTPPKTPFPYSGCYFAARELRTLA